VAAKEEEKVLPIRVHMNNSSLCVCARVLFVYYPSRIKSYAYYYVTKAEQKAAKEEENVLLFT